MSAIGSVEFWKSIKIRGEHRTNPMRFLYADPLLAPLLRIIPDFSGGSLGPHGDRSSKRMLDHNSRHQDEAIDTKFDVVL